MKVVRGWAAGVLLLAGAGCWEETTAEKGADVERHFEQDAGAKTDAEVDEAEGEAQEPAADDKAKDAGATRSSNKAATSKSTEASKPAQRATTAQSASKPAAEHEPSEPADDDAGVSMPSMPAEPAGPTQPMEQATLVGLGERLFNDASLSLSGTQSCASCHDAGSAFTGSADREHPFAPVSRGAVEGAFGTRNAPTAMYTRFSPPFAFVPEPENPSEFTPTGGLFWDGRVSSLSEQAGGPFINPREMALPDKQAVVDRVLKADYAWMLEPLFGPDPLSDVAQGYQHITDAIAAFERTPRFQPFSSKFDAYLRGQVSLSEQEQRGFDLFKDPEKGNCIACHVGLPESREPRDWLFTDFTYDNLGVPRNMKIADNAEPTYFDLGLCQSEVVMTKVPAAVEDKATFLSSACGAFKVPTLRNVGKTAPYMHNGFFENLRDVVDFYVTRETEPARWYPSAEDGTVYKYNDLPEQYRGNVNTEEVPYDRKTGEQPRLSPEEIDAVVAFLLTLTDGPTLNSQHSEALAPR